MKKLKTLVSIMLMSILTCCMFLLCSCGTSIAGTYKFDSLSYSEGGISMELKAGEQFMGMITLSEDIMMVTLNEDGTVVITESLESVSETSTGTWTRVDEHTLEFTIDGDTQSVAWNGDTLTINEDGAKINLKK